MHMVKEVKPSPHPPHNWGHIFIYHLTAVRKMINEDVTPRVDTELHLAILSIFDYAEPSHISCLIGVHPEITVSGRAISSQLNFLFLTIFTEG